MFYVDPNLQGIDAAMKLPVKKVAWQNGPAAKKNCRLKDVKGGILVAKEMLVSTKYQVLSTCIKTDPSIWVLPKFLLVPSSAPLSK